MSMKKWLAIAGVGLYGFSMIYRLVNRRMTMRHTEKYNDQIIRLADVIGKYSNDTGKDAEINAKLLHVE